jgi:hypothetical protein
MKGTKFSRLLFQLQPKTHRTEETDAGLLPTPTAMMDEAPIEKVDARNHKQMEKGNSPFILGLGQQAMRGMLPTPSAMEDRSTPEAWDARYERKKSEGINLQMGLCTMARKGMLPTPTVMDSTNNGDMTAAAKLMQGATHRSSGQPIQKTLTMEIHQQILADNQPLMEELANKPMLKRTNLPPQKEFVDWIRSVTNAKELSTLIDVKLSTVEHWFRMDAKGFSHPSIEEWIKISEIFPVTEQMNARMMEQSSIEWRGMLPTPNAAEGYKSAKTYNPKSQMGSSLSAMAGSGMLPTPTAMDSTNATATMKSTQVKEGSMHSVTLTRALSMGMLPTPVAGEYRDTGEAVKTGNFKQMNLTRTIAKDNPEWTGKTSQLNPRFVAEMMGFPHNWTELPFQSGEQNQSKDTAMP